MPVRTMSMRLPSPSGANVAECTAAAAEAHVLELHAQVVRVGRVDLRDAVAVARLGFEAGGFECAHRALWIEILESKAQVVDLGFTVCAALVHTQELVAQGQVRAAGPSTLHRHANRALVELQRALHV